MSRWILSLRARNTPPSPIRKLAASAQEAKRRGIEVHHLNIGQPDVATPPSFFEGLQRFDRDIVGYERSQGTPALREKWSEFMERETGVDVPPENFLITMGASEALVFLFMVLCDPGDEVIIFDPTYANYIGFAAIAGVNLVPLVTEMDNDFALPEREAIVEHLTNRTRAILLCSPNNPTGTLYDREQLTYLLELCHKYRLFLVVDETYRELIFDGREPLSIFQVAGRDPQVVVVDSLSKRFSLCGSRIGCILTFNDAVISNCLALAQARLAAPTIEQHAAAFMLEQLPPGFLKGVRDEYQLRRDVLLNALREFPGVEAHKPQGAFYTLARFPVACTEDFARFLLEEFSSEGETTFVAPAAGFYMADKRGLSKIRIASVLNSESLQRAVKIVGAGLKAYQERANARCMDD